MQILVGWPGQCFHSLEARRRAGHCGCGTCCHVPKDRSQSAAILQEMRWPSYDQSSSARIGGRICSDVTDVEVQRGCPRQLCRNSFAYAGRTSQAEGFSQRVWRLRRSRGGVRSMSAIGVTAERGFGLGRVSPFDQRGHWLCTGAKVLKAVSPPYPPPSGGEGKKEKKPPLTLPPQPQRKKKKKRRQKKEKREQQSEKKKKKKKKKKEELEKARERPAKPKNTPPQTPQRKKKK